MRIPIVNEQDEILEYKDADDHNPKVEIARTSALWLINERDEVLIARRSKSKRFNPGVWGASVTGRNEEGETYESNILKEAKEELGYDVRGIITGYKELIRTEDIFFVQHFFAIIPKDAQFTLLESEVDEVRWIKVGDLENWYNKTPEDFSSPFNYSIKAIKYYESQNKKTK